MKILYHKMMIALIMIIMTVAHAADDIHQGTQKKESPLRITRTGAVSSTNNFGGFSHTVLTLLDDPRNEEPWSQVISSQNEWESFFNAPKAYMLFLEGQEPIAAEFDFEKYQILTGGLGVRSSGGHSLVVEGVVELDNVIDIQVLEIRPDTQCIVPAMISYPSATVLVKKTDKPFQFTIIQLVNECLD